MSRRVELADLPSVGADIRRRSFAFNRRPGERNNRGRIPPEADPVPAELTLAQGCVLLIDADYAGTKTDGATVTAPINRSGSNAAIASTVGTPIYESTGWNGEKACFHLTSDGMRFTGSDLDTVGNGTNKTWHVYMTVEHVRRTTSASYFFAFDRSTAPDLGIEILTSGDTYNLRADGQVGAGLDASFKIGLEHLIMDCSYSAGQIQFGINSTRAAAYNYALGINIVSNGFNIGGTQNTALCDIRVRNVAVFNKKLAAASAQEVAVLAYLKSRCGSSFTKIASLGAT